MVLHIFCFWLILLFFMLILFEFLFEEFINNELIYSKLISSFLTIKGIYFLTSSHFAKYFNKGIILTNSVSPLSQCQGLIGIPLFLLYLYDTGLLSIIITSFNFKFRAFKFLINFPLDKRQLSL